MRKTKKNDAIILIDKLQECMSKIGKERDKMADLLEQYTAVIDDCGEAREYLESAIDKLSSNV